MKIKLLKANKGDCFLISYKDELDYNRNILIDSGTVETYYDGATNTYGDLKTEIDAIKTRKECIDLLILTHIDNDHICGLLKWLEIDEDAYKIIRNIWFNSGKLIADYFNSTENVDLQVGLHIFRTPETGVTEAVKFEDYLIDKKIWDKKIVINSQEITQNGTKIQVLSPSESQLKKLLSEYRLKTKDPAYTAGKEKDWAIDLDTFITEEESKKYKFVQDKSIKNASSIAFILTIDNKKFLFLGDSHPNSLIKSLKKMGVSKEIPLEVEFFKVSHHGSKFNTNKELLELVKTDNYIISTDSSGDNHPNKRTLSRIIKNNPNAIIHFNYQHVKESIISDKDFSDYTKFKIKVTTEFNF